MSMDTMSAITEGVETEQLKLQMHVHIGAVENDQTFMTGYYNIIVLNVNAGQEERDTFIKLCELHALQAEELDFKEFFYSIITLFQMPAEQEYKNAIGLFGELSFMLYTFNNTQNDISVKWHLNGSRSKTDFANGEVGIEIKSSLKDERMIKIKHQQIFDGNLCYLAVVLCEDNSNGKTLEEIVEIMENTQGAFESLSFKIRLEKEIKRISQKSFKERRFLLKSVHVYNAESINPFEDVPDNVYNISYELDLSSAYEIEEEQLRLILSEF